MTIRINGQPRDISADEITVSALLDDLGFGGKPVVVELNFEPVFPANYGDTAVKDGANIEIVTIAAGG